MQRRSTGVEGHFGLAGARQFYNNVLGLSGALCGPAVSRIDKQRHAEVQAELAFRRSALSATHAGAE